MDQSFKSLEVLDPVVLLEKLFYSAEEKNVLFHFHVAQRVVPYFDMADLIP